MNKALSRAESGVVLGCVVLGAALTVYGQLVRYGSRAVALECLLFSVALAALVLGARAATIPAALVGVLLAFTYGTIPGCPHSPLWVLSAALLLTLGASRVGRERKRAQGTAEGRRGRVAAQVAANLGVGACTGLLVPRYGAVLAHTVLLAALAEVTADTLGSELGQLATRLPRMLLTGKQVPAGTDGAVSVPGTLAGCAGALLVGGLSVWALGLPWQAAAVGVVAGIAGQFFDSVLGQVLERRHCLNNDAVNFLSSAAAALMAFVAGCGLL